MMPLYVAWVRYDCGPWNILRGCDGDNLYLLWDRLEFWSFGCENAETVVLPWGDVPAKTYRQEAQP